MSVYKKLHTIQQAINGLGKDKAAYGYKYVTGDKVLEHIKPMMNDLGLILKQEIISIDNTRQDYATKSGSTSEILSKVMMRFTWIDIETGEKDENLFGANGQNAWDKGVGSALTYGERYFLLKFFHIATDEDDIDNPDRKSQEPATAQAPATIQKPTATPAPIVHPELLPSTDKWEKVKQALLEGTATWNLVKTKLSITPDNEKLMDKEVKKAKAEAAERMKVA